MKIRACHKISWKKLISCLCFFYSYTWSYGQQQYGFTFYTREDGIASATITGIAKDSTGFLWLFSENGLTRFDGYDFKIFQNNPSDVLSISSPYISDMLIDSKKNIYFHAYNSISKYNPSHNTFTRLLSYFNNEYFLGWRSGKNCIWVMVKGSLIAITPDNPATYYALPAEFLIRNKPHMIESDNNFFIIGHNKIIRFDIEKKEFFDVPTFLLSGNNYEPENTSMRLFVDKEGTPGFCSSSGLFKYDKAGKKFLQKVAFYPNPATAGPFPSSVILRNNYSFAVLNNGTLQQVDLNVGSEKIISLSNHFDNEKGILIKAVYTGKGNNIWLTTNTPKFYSYHPETGLMEAFEAKGEKNTTRNNYFIFEDENGIVWISIAGSGLVKAEPVRKIFDLQRPSDSKIVYVSDNIRGISEWTKDSVLVNTINGVLLLNKSTSQFANFSYPEKSFSGSAYSKIIVDKDTNLWIAGWQRQGLFYVNRKTGSITKFFPLSDPQGKSVASVRTMLIDSKGFLWIGASDNTILRTKVSQIDFSNPEKTFFESFNSTTLNNENLIFNITFDIIENSKQEIYFGTQSGVYIYNYDSKKLLPLNFNGSNNPISDVRAFCFDKNSVLWMGTNGSGLYAYNELTRQLKTYTTKNGLPDNSVYTILSDNKNNLWLGTNKGLCRFNPIENNVRNFSLKDGIQNYEYNTNAACKLSTGELAFGGINGLNIFYPDSIQTFSYIPDIVITEFKVQENQKPVTGSIINLTADENYISFQFAALNYVRNEENQYAYQLKGLDKDWIYCDKRRFTNYANLSPGQYTFRVKCCNANGVWNEKGTSLSFFIATPWYNTWWFRSLLLFIVIAGVYGWYRYRLYQTLRLQAVRDRIGRDLHDEIGSTLQSISFYSEVAGKIVEEKAPEAKSMLAQITESTTNMMEAMSDIVWAINTRNDSFANIINRMRAFAVEVLEAKNCTLHFDISDSLMHYNLEMEDRKNLYLIFKESINNAAKHSGCKNVSVYFYPKANLLNLIIADDGKGFLQKEDFRGNGLFNIKKRASELKGTIEILSEPGKGTTINLSFEH